MISEQFLGRALACLLSLTGLTACGTDDMSSTDLASTTDALRSSPVHFAHGWRYTGWRYGAKWTTSRYRVLVANLGFEKDVSIWSEGVDGQWRALPATYAGSVSQNRELWEAVEPTEATGAFAVRYEVGGHVYWDNNQGQNYVLPSSGAMLPDGVNIAQEYAYGLDQYHEDDVYLVFNVRNLTPEKKVTAVYTTDHWATQHTLDLSFNPSYFHGYGYIESPNSAGVEVWSGSIRVPNADEFEYAVSAEMGGQTYWDNHFGVNYKIVRKP
ncbi:MAG: hypothetical protein IPK13_05085 [Deltaproteobacteria bacterium]|nr:hypothetical protein [Deltaproteobacteria bacterium]